MCHARARVCASAHVPFLLWDAQSRHAGMGQLGEGPCPWCCAALRQPPSPPPAASQPPLVLPCAGRAGIWGLLPQGLMPRPPRTQASAHIRWAVPNFDCSSNIEGAQGCQTEALAQCGKRQNSFCSVITYFGEIQTGLVKLCKPLTKPYPGVAWESHCRNPYTAPLQPAVAPTLQLQAGYRHSKYRGTKGKIYMQNYF